MIIKAASLLVLALANPQPLPGGTEPSTAAALPPNTGSAPALPRGPIGYMTAAALEERCTDPSPYAATYCFAYLAGIHDAVRAYEVWLGENEFCAPPQISQKELRDVFLAFLARNPGYRPGLAASVAVVALKDKFACPVPKS